MANAMALNTAVCIKQHAPLAKAFLTFQVQELGFTVIEINPSQDRSGVQLARMVGEATQSRRLAHQQQAQQGQEKGSKSSTEVGVRHRLEGFPYCM